ncbi:class IV adenylate cyclase [Streptomyces sp. WAC01490]|uniref:class IV adenylate cyclase n=1 Tax=unclassified Streptomyces TaxID=2593676 RepID=UPI003F347E6B
MKHEYEAKFLAVDVADLQNKLSALGAVQAFPRTLLTRKIFENDFLDGGAWIRLRDEGTRSTLTLKQVFDATTINGTKEIETEVTDLHAMADILRRVGLTEVRYQENYREEWRLGEVAFDFDTWPVLPTFLEIEGPDEASVRQAAALLDLDYSEARFGSVDEIYKSESSRDILAEPTLLFSEAEKQKDASPTAQDR